MLDEIMRLKNSSNQVVAATTVFELVREKIEHSIKRKLNETDWKVLNVLLVEPVMTNKEIAQKVFLKRLIHRWLHVRSLLLSSRKINRVKLTL